jgi:rhodanese-related sulfurtransferase
MGNLLSILKMVFGAGSTNPADDVAPQEAIRLLKSNNSPQLVDVRSTAENRLGRIAGSKLIPLDELGNRLAEIDKNKSVLLYCQSGNRSSMALRLLKGQGFTQAAHISGGISSWRRKGLPVEN